MQNSRISRRQVLVTLGAGVLGYTSCIQPALADARAKADGERWMAQWMESPRQPVGGLYLGRFADPIYFLTQPIKWAPNAGQAYGEVAAPTGFVTDLASIPRLFWSLLRPDGVYAYAAILHDYLYWFQPLPRKDCDAIFKLAMKDFGIEATTVNAIYEAVRKGGGQAWSDNEKLRKRGEKRILSAFPDDPRTRWDAWKKDPAHFV